MSGPATRRSPSRRRTRSWSTAVAGRWTAATSPKTFAALVTAAGIKAPPGQRAPRLHDLRHVFTVATLLDWYRDGGDVQARLPVLSTWLGHVDPKSTYWYLSAVPELLALAAARLEPAGRKGRRHRDRPGPRPAGVLHRPAGPAEEGQPEHGRRLPRHLPAPARLRPRAGPARHPARSASPTSTPRLVGAFLQHLEDQRGNGSATRNARLAAIHSLFTYAAPKAPEHAAVISQVLAIPPRRRERAIVSYLTPEEIDALVAAPDRDDLARPPRPRPAPARRPDRAAGLRAHRPDRARTSTWAPGRTSAATARAARTGHPADQPGRGPAPGTASHPPAAADRLNGAPAGPQPRTGPPAPAPPRTGSTPPPRGPQRRSRARHAAPPAQARRPPMT